MRRTRVVAAVLVLAVVVAAGGAALFFTLRDDGGSVGAFTAGRGGTTEAADEQTAVGEGRRRVGSEGDAVAADASDAAPAGPVTRAQRLQWIREWLEIACGQGYSRADRRRARQAVLEFDDAESVPLILELACDPDPEAYGWGWATSLLGDMGPRAAAAIPDLITLLRRDEERGHSAAFALARIGAPAVDALLASLAADGPDVQLRVLTVLGTIGDPPRRVTESVIGMLGHADEELRVEAIGALYRSSGAPDLVVPAAIGALSDSSAEVRSGATMVLYMLGPAAAPAVAALGSALDDASTGEWAAMALGRIGPAASSQTEKLVTLLTGNPEGWDRTIPKALAGIGTAALLEALGSESTGARLAVMPLVPGAVEADGTTATAAVAALDFALASDEADVRRAAADALGALGVTASSTVAALLQLADDPNPVVRRAALIAVVRVGGAREKVLDVLVRELRDGTDMARAAAAEALGELGQDGAAAVDALAAAMNDPDLVVRQRAARALESIGPRAISAASAVAGRLGDHAERVRLAAAIALIAVDPPGLAARDTIGTLRISDDPAIRQGVVLGLGRHPNAVWLDVVVNRVDDRIPWVRSAAAQALAQYTAHSPTVVPAVVARLEKERDASVQIALIETLSRHGRDAADAIPVLERIAAADRVLLPVRDAVREALARLR